MGTIFSRQRYISQQGQSRTDLITSAQTISPVDSPGDSRQSLLDGLLSRRSVHPKRLIEPAPNTREVQKIISAAATATDHCGLQPWRFLSISGRAKEHLAEVFVKIKLAREPETTLNEIERERDRARAVPLLIAVIARLQPNHQLVPLSEQYASVGAAIQNMLLCIHGLGYGAKMVSGRKCRDQKLSATFNLGNNETLFGFVCIGTAVPGTKQKQRVSSQDVLSIWEPKTSVQALSNKDCYFVN